MTVRTLQRLIAGALIAGAAGLGLVLTETAATAATPGCNEHQNEVAAVDTADAAASICQWQGDGRLEYHGVYKPTGDRIDIPVTEVVEQGNGSGLYSYSAVNNGVTYRVDDQTALAIVDGDGTLLFYERQ